MNSKLTLHLVSYKSDFTWNQPSVCITTGQSNEKSRRRTCPNTQTKQKPKFVLLGVGNPVLVRRQADESLQCGKDNREKPKTQSGTLGCKLGPISTADELSYNISFLANINHNNIIFPSKSLMYVLPARSNFQSLAPVGSLLTFFFKDLEVAKGGKERFFSVYCAFKT